MSFINRNVQKVFTRFFNYFDYNLVRVNRNDVSLYTRLYGEMSVENRLFCNISAGGHFDFGCGIHHPCWTNIDLDRPWKDYIYSETGIEYNPDTDIAHDFLTSEPIPLKSDTIELVHSRNSIEHLPDKSVEFMFKEIYRILKPGGVFRVAAPDIDHLYRVFLRNDRNFFYWFDDTVSIEQAFLIHFASHVSTLHHEDSGTLKKISDNELREIFKKNKFEDALEYCSTMCSMDVYKKDRVRDLSALFTHINWWNKNKLTKFLSLAGFDVINISAPEQSQSPVMRNTYYFDNYANYSVFYMEAVKS